MKKLEVSKKAKEFFYIQLCRSFLIWPLVIAAGRMATRAVLNLWDMIEP